MVNGTLLNFGKRYDDNLRVIFDQSVAKVALRFECAKQSKNFDRYLVQCVTFYSDFIS